MMLVTMTLTLSILPTKLIYCLRVLMVGKWSSLKYCLSSFNKLANYEECSGEMK